MRGMRGRDLRNDIVERQRRGVDDPRTRRAVRQNLARHQRASIEADRTGGNEVAPAKGEEIGGARSCPDEMHRHGPSPSAIAAVAVRSCETTRELTSRALRPAATSATASAKEPTPNIAATRSERVAVSTP